MTDTTLTPAELTALLEQCGLNQVQAAKAIGISDRNMRRYIAGDLPVPRPVRMALELAALRRGQRGTSMIPPDLPGFTSTM